MTGAYLRVKRNDKYENVEIEYLTDEERTVLFKDKPEEMLKWFNFACNVLKEVSEYLAKKYDT